MKKNLKNKKSLNIAMLGHKRIPSREGGIEIVVEELATRMVTLGHKVTCYNRSGHHVSGKDFDGGKRKAYSMYELPICRDYRDELPEGVELPAGRTKPWGTGQAVLACKEVLHEPFAVINADDYYGKEAFVKLHNFLVGYVPEKANQFCMAGFILKNTLSENGAVTRGICETNEEGYLTAVHETSNIVKTPEGAAVDNDGQLTSINAESYASMNMWGLTPEFMQTLEDGFKEFFANMGDKDILKAEYLLPIYIDELLQAGRVSVKVLDTNDKWFGVTYKEDKDYVVKSFARLIEAGVYQKDLFEDLK